MEPRKPLHDDAIWDAKKEAKAELTRNLKAAVNAQRLLKAAGCDLAAKKIVGIKHLRETLGLDLITAKDAWEIAFDLREAS